MKPILCAAIMGTAVLVAFGRGAAGQPHTAAAEMAPLFLPSAIQWKPGPPSVPPGAQLAVLEGDPTKEGPFTMRLKLPDGYRIPPHVHPKTERLTVISGTFRFGTGERFDEKALRDMPAGTYGYWPAGMKHFVQARGETVVQLHGMGPWQIIYLNPKGDPRTRAGRDADTGLTAGSGRSSGPQPGERVESFQAVALTGPFRGRQVNGPVVLAFVGDTQDGTAELAARLRRLQQRYEPRSLRIGLIYVGGPEVEEMLRRVVVQEEFTVPVGRLPNGRHKRDLAPYRLAPEARNTVILYRGQKVRHTFVNLDERTFPALLTATEQVFKEAERSVYLTPTHSATA